MKKMSRLAALILACASLLCSCSSPAQSGGSSASSTPAQSPSSSESTISEAAQKYPSEQVITWYTLNSGNITDTIARIVVPYLSKELGQDIVIENAGGAGGMNKLNPVYNGKADGYTIASLPVASLCLTPFSQDCAYEYTDFEMLYNVFRQPQVMVVSGDAPYSTFEEWRDWVEANPGQFRFGVPGASTVHNIAMQGLKLESGLNYETIYYGNAGEVIAALMGNHIEGLVLGYSECESAINSGDFKLIAFTTEDKAEGYDVPSLAELGYESHGVAFQGICMKAGTDPDVVAKLKSAFDKVFADPEVIAELEKAGAWIDGTFMESEAFTELVKSTYEYYEETLTETGLMEELYG